MKVINVEGNEIKVDEEDYLYLILFYNFKMNGKYVSCQPKVNYKKMGLYTRLQMHKLIISPDKTGRSIVVDHKDGDFNNNQKSNLRICTHAENMRNRTKRSFNTTSIYKGVHWNSKLGVWEAQLRNVLYIGIFSDEIAAANAYNYHALLHYKEFSKDNTAPYMEVEEWEKFRIRKKKTSKYHGVCFTENRWIAQICHKGEKWCSERYLNEVDAAKAYNDKAFELKGKKAKLNTIDT